MSALLQPPQAAPSNGKPKLKRSMGLWMATALVVGNMVGSGVFLLPASLAGTAGPISMFGWVFTGAGAILLALVFANLGRALPRTGGPYAYAQAGVRRLRRLPDRVGLLDRGLGRQRGDRRRVRRLPRRVLAAASATDKLLGALVGIARDLAAHGDQHPGRRARAACVQLVTTVLKFVPLAVIGIVGLFFIDGGNYEPFAPHGTSIEPAVHRPRR